MKQVYLSLAGPNLDKIGDFGQTKKDTLENIFLVSLVIAK